MVHGEEAATLSDEGDRVVWGAAVADEPAADDGARASVATPAVDVDDLALREGGVDRVEDLRHLVDGGDVVVDDRERVPSRT